MKCEKYWADKGTTRLIGDFTIQSVSEDVAAEYTVRTFTVFKVRFVYDIGLNTLNKRYEVNS